MGRGDYWYNYKAKEYEYIDMPKDFHDYIPQIPAAQNLYDLLVQEGKLPIEAAKEVLKAACGRKES